MMTDELDRWLSPITRAEVERLYYEEVNRQARFESLSRDPAFLEAIRAGESHAGLFADHGVVHVRDVAHQILHVLDHIHGHLIPERPAWRLNSMKGYGVLLAYFHDIGMFDFSAFGRAMHPEFATHTIFHPQFNPLLDAIWRENSANLAWRLSQLEAIGGLEQPPQLVLRELLALCMAHSKSKVPIDVLNDRTELRQLLIETISTDLSLLYGVQRVKIARQRLIRARQGGDPDVIVRWQLTLEATERALAANQLAATTRRPELGRYYHRPLDEAFLWLVSEHPETRELVEDSLDTVRALRGADALRQRGTVLKTSGGYEIFISRQTGHAVFSLQAGDSSLYLLEYPDKMSAGEANLASSELDSNGDLRISFHRGAFDTTEAFDYVVEATSFVVDDIVQDSIGSFRRPPAEPRITGMKGIDEVQLLLEEAEDSPTFAARLRERVEIMNPWLRGRIQLVPSLRDTSERERERYLAAAPLNWDLAARQDFLDRIRRSGQLTDHIDPDLAFRDVRLVQLQAGDVLIDAGATAAFVYIPMGQGLRIIPLGGYESLAARAWTPLGVTGVIRGAARNATVVAEAPLRLVMIPKGAYLRDWSQVHTPESFVLALGEEPSSKTAVSTLSLLERAQLLGRVSLFAQVGHEALMELAGATSEHDLSSGMVLFEKGAPGDSLFVVASGSVRIVDAGETLTVLGPGKAFGEMAVLTPEPRSAAAIVEEDARLLRLPAEAFAVFLREHGEAAGAVTAVLARRLREQSAEVLELRLRLAGGTAATG